MKATASPEKEPAATARSMMTPGRLMASPAQSSPARMIWHIPGAYDASGLLSSLADRARIRDVTIRRARCSFNIRQHRVSFDFIPLLPGADFAAQHGNYSVCVSRSMTTLIRCFKSASSASTIFAFECRKLLMIAPLIFQYTPSSILISDLRKDSFFSATPGHDDIIYPPREPIFSSAASWSYSVPLTLAISASFCYCHLAALGSPRRDRQSNFSLSIFIGARMPSR